MNKVLSVDEIQIKTKKATYVVSIFLLVILLVSVCFFAFKWHVRERNKNVFDEIYYSELFLMDWGFVFFPNYLKPSLAHVDGIDKSGRWGALMSGWTDDWTVESYKKNSIGENKEIKIWFYKDQKVMIIKYKFRISEEITLSFTYHYNVETKCLHQSFLLYDTLLEEDFKEGAVYSYLDQLELSILDIKQYSNEALYEIFLNDWFVGNEGYSQFSLDNLGKLTITKDPILE